MILELPKPKQRNLFFTKDVDAESIAKLTEALIEIEESDKDLKKIYELHDLEYTPKPIKIYIDSYGGYVYQCYGLLSVMKACKTPIHTIVTGCAMSCGFLISVSGHKRISYDHSTFMYHQVSSGAIGKLKDMEEDIIETKRLQKFVEEHTLTTTKLTPKDLEKCYIEKRDWYFTAKQALKYGIIDQIV
jgi:ATP-dependent Clp protease protease subunit